LLIFTFGFARHGLFKHRGHRKEAGADSRRQEVQGGRRQGQSAGAGGRGRR
jgi:hypothetical protein